MIYQDLVHILNPDSGHYVYPTLQLDPFHSDHYCTTTTYAKFHISLYVQTAGQYPNDPTSHIKFGSLK